MLLNPSCGTPGPGRACGEFFLQALLAPSHSPAVIGTRNRLKCEREVPQKRFPRPQAPVRNELVIITGHRRPFLAAYCIGNGYSDESRLAFGSFGFHVPALAFSLLWGHVVRQHFALVQNAPMASFHHGRQKQLCQPENRFHVQADH